MFKKKQKRLTKEQELKLKAALFNPEFMNDYMYLVAHSDEIKTEIIPLTLFQKLKIKINSLKIPSLRMVK